MRLHLVRQLLDNKCIKCGFTLLDSATRTMDEDHWRKQEDNCEVVPPREGKTFKMATGGNH